jgi:DNA replication and repair protein RecF
LQAERRGVVPLMLFDDVAAHLDRQHRAALFDAIASLGAQAWYAGTDRSIFEPLAGRAQYIALGETIAMADTAPAEEKEGADCGHE